jgi:uncharacterized membrane protein
MEIPKRDTGSKKLQAMIRLAHAIYGSFFVGGVPSFVGAMASAMKVNDAKGTWIESHFKWQIRTVCYAIVSFILVCYFGSLDGGIMIIGVLFIIAWMLFRNIRGWVALNDEKPMPQALLSLHPAIPIVVFVLFLFAMSFWIVIAPLEESLKQMKEFSQLGVDLNVATRGDVRKALQEKGLEVLQEDDRSKRDTYSSSKIMEGSTTLEAVYFVGDEQYVVKEMANQPLIGMEYTFAGSPNRDLFHRMLSKLEQKCGKASFIEKLPHGEPTRFKWGSKEGAEIELRLEWPENRFRLSYYLNARKQEMEKIIAKEKYKDV